jgi:hypothetical protein
MSRAGRGAGTLLGLLAFLGMSAAGAQASAGPVPEPPVPTQASLPADLVALEQRTAALRFETERLTVQMELQSKEGLLGPGSPALVFLLAGQGQIRASPEEGSFTISFFGQTSEVREVGGNIYTFEPSAAKIDGGRSWVRSKATSPPSALVAGPAGLGEQLGGSAGTFAGVLALIGAASSVQETGPAIVDDQPTTEFTAAIDPSRLAGFEKLLETGQGGGVGRELRGHKGAPPSVRLEVFLAANGLPVRIRFAIHAADAFVTLTSDTLALEVPVEVRVPPAREVIGASRLKVLRARQRVRERARLERALRRICRKLPPKERAKCKRLPGAPAPHRPVRKSK